MSGAILDTSDFERCANCQKLHRRARMIPKMRASRYYCDDECEMEYYTKSIKK